MDSLFRYVLTTRTAEETQRFGFLLGQHIKTGLVLRLTGNLGCGKTCFVQGLARGLDVPDEYPVTSPTYALMHEFPGRLTLFHVDLYRIHNETDADTIGLWEVIGHRNIVAVEWADRLDAAYWPEASIQIDFQTSGDDTRKVTVIACGLQVVDLIKEIGTSWNKGKTIGHDN